MTSAHSAASSLQTVRNSSQIFLDDLFKKRIADADALSSRYGDLWRSIYKLATTGGKRIRPYITTVAYEAYGGDIDSKDIQYAAHASELLHIAVLIHDDIIDRDVKRYGTKNITGQYLDVYDEAFKNQPKQALHFANSAALLAGDVLISEAYRLLAQMTDASDENKSSASQYFSEAVFVVCGGELIDVESSFLRDKASPRQIATLKTASYSFIGPMLIGAALAGADHTQRLILRNIAETLGVAYQFVDDFLGVFGDKNVTGKTTTGDIRERKHTFVVERFYELASPEQVTQFEQIFHAPDLLDEQYREVVDLFVEVGVYDICRLEIDRLSGQIEANITKLAVGDEYKDALREVVSMCLKRDK